LAGGTIRTDTASHVDVPPTILGLLGLARENHFLGRDLFRDPPRPTVAVLNGGVSLIHDDIMLVGSYAASESLVKVRYDEGPLDDPTRCGHGAILAVTPADREAFGQARTAIAAYAWLIDHDQLAPTISPR
jgi:arylsulfatase A-like enzyme